MLPHQFTVEKVHLPRPRHMVCALPNTDLLHPESCPCKERVGTLAKHGLHRLCQPSVLCTLSVNASIAKATLRSPPAAFVTVLHADDRHVRPRGLSGAPTTQWRVQARRVVELAANLRAVNASLPLHCLLTGRNLSAVNITAMRMQHNMQLHTSWKEPTVPTWASKMHQATFAKLSVMNASLQLGRRLIYLDTDMLLLRNIDHLAKSLPPDALAFTFRADHELVNSGIMSFHVSSQSRLDAAWRLIARAIARRPWQACSGDGGDQQVWIYFLARTTEPLIELPASYNLYPPQLEQLNDTRWCERAHAIHKSNKLARGSCLDFVQRWERKARRVI